MTAAADSGLDEGIGHLAARLDAAARCHAERPLFVGEPSITYREAAAASRALAAGLARRGVRAGDRVLIVAENAPEVILLVFAVARLGAVFCLLHHHTTKSALAKIAEKTAPRLAIFDVRTAPLSAALPASVVAAALPDLSRDRDGTEPLVEPSIGQEALACLIFTSGSSGAPRGVMVSHRNIAFATRAIQERLGYHATDVIGLFLPLSFDYGLYQVFLAMDAGAALAVHRPESTGPGFLSLMAKHGVTVAPLMPGLIAGAIKLLSRRSAALPDLRAITSTGEHLSPDDIDALRRFLPNVQIFSMYGLTECKRVAILLPDERAAKRGSVGRPLSGTSVIVRDEALRALPAGEVGEITVRGPHVTQGYFGDREATEARFGDGSGELRTGDLGWLDVDGFLYVRGRRDAQIKHLGFRISAVEIEQAALEIDGVIEAGLVRTKGDALCLFLRWRARAQSDDDVRAWLSARLEPYKVPEIVMAVDDLPRTPNGKIDRVALAQKIEAA